MKIFKIIAAATLVLTLAAPLSTAAGSTVDFMIEDPVTGQFYFYGKISNVTGTTQGRLGEVLKTGNRWGETVTCGAVGPIEIYVTESNPRLESELMGSSNLRPLELRADGALYFDADKEDYCSIGVDEDSGEGSGTITSDGYYAWVPTYETGMGNDGVVFLQVGGEVGTPMPETFAGFTDVKAGDYFAEAVQWAVDAGVTSGTSATTFSPEQTCTRGQVVTFLWRMYGMEAADMENPFQDMDQQDYFYQAALWAYENGITSGTSATTFSPDQTCSRGEIVTFLWRAAGKPEAAQSMAFTDVAEGSYCYDAVRWAAQEGIATGSGSFNPGSAANRAQTVTFLFRA